MTARQKQRRFTPFTYENMKTEQCERDLNDQNVKDSKYEPATMATNYLFCSREIISI